MTEQTRETYINQLKKSTYFSIKNLTKNIRQSMAGAKDGTAGDTKVKILPVEFFNKMNELKDYLELDEDGRYVKSEIESTDDYIKASINTIMNNGVQEVVSSGISYTLSDPTIDKRIFLTKTAWNRYVYIFSIILDMYKEPDPVVSDDFLPPTEDAAEKLKQEMYKEMFDYGAYYQLTVLNVARMEGIDYTKYTDAYDENNTHLEKSAGTCYIFDGYRYKWNESTGYFELYSEDLTRYKTAHGIEDPVVDEDE